MLNERLRFRVTDEFKKNYTELGKELNITHTGLFMLAIEFFIHNKKNISKKLIKRYTNEFNRYALKNARQRQTDDLHCMFLLKNTTKRIMEISWNSHIHMQKPNMNAIKRIITNAQTIYEEFPKELKEILIEDIETICKFGNEAFLLSFTIENQSRLQYMDKYMRTLQKAEAKVIEFVE